MIKLIAVALIVTILGDGAWGNCCYPMKIEGDIGLTGGVVADTQPLLQQGMIKFAYDFTNYKGYINASVVTGPTPSHLEMFQDFNPKHMVMYTVLEVEGKLGCVKSNMTMAPMRCIPAGASEANWFMGIPGAGMPVTSYHFTMGGYDIWSTVTKTKDKPNDCIPLGTVQSGKQENVAFIQTIGFINVSLSISNPHIFDIPDLCKKAYRYTKHDHSKGFAIF